MNYDLIFISGQFFEAELPKEKKFLTKYFTKPGELAFLKYYLTFGSCNSFQEHTGFPYKRTLVRRLEKKLQKLLELQKQARDNFDVQLLLTVESGKFDVSEYD